MSAYQPKTGQACGCRKGTERDNCPMCEGTGQVIDFAAIRARAPSRRPTFTPGRRVVLRAGARYSIHGSSLQVGEGGKSATVVDARPDLAPENINAIDAHGVRIRFASEDATLAGPLP